MFWYPTKPKIQDWVDYKALEFAWEESEGSRLRSTEWLERHLYPNIHDIFFTNFLSYFMWLLKLVTQRKNFQRGEPTKWSPQLIQWLKRTRNPISRVFEFLVDSTIVRYITKIAIDTIKSYSET